MYHCIFSAMDEAVMTASYPARRTPIFSSWHAYIITYQKIYYATEGRCSIFLCRRPNYQFLFRKASTTTISWAFKKNHLILHSNREFEFPLNKFDTCFQLLLVTFQFLNFSFLQIFSGVVSTFLLVYIMILLIYKYLVVLIKVFHLIPNS